MIITSHYMADIQALCDRAVIINQGQLVYDGKLNDINRFFGEKRLVSIKTAETVAGEQWETFGRVREMNPRGAVLEVPRDKTREILASVMAALPVEDFTVTEVPLEESIARYYQKTG